MTQVNNERLEAKTQSIELVKRIESAKSSDLATAEHKFSQIRENHNTTIRRVFEALPPDLKKLQKLSKSLADRPENSLPDSSIKSEIQNTRLSLAVQLSESLTSDGEKALQRAADLLDSASEFAKNGDTARAKTRVEFSKRIQGFVEAQAGKSLSERTDVDGFNRGTVAEVAYELYDTANELDKSGSPASGDLVLEHAQFLMNAATFALRLFPVVDSVLSTIEAASGRTVDYNSFGEPYFRETTTIERSFALAQVGLTAAGALLGGPAGVLAAGTLFDIGKAIGKREGKVLAKQAAESAFAKGLGKAEQEVAESAAKETAEQAAEQLGKEAEKVLDSARKIGFKTAAEIKQHAGVLERWSPNFKAFKIEEAAAVNAGFDQAPYLVGTKVIQFETTAGESFVRVHGPGNQARIWVLREADIAGLSASEIAAKFNIKDTPNQISRVNIPSGTKIRTGIVGPNAFGGSKGAIQFEIQMDRVPPEWFTKIGDL